MEAFDIFDKAEHLQPNFDKIIFDSLHRWDLGWELLSLINVADSPDENKELSRRFSPGQKALYFFWYLDGAVTNGGFVQFYWNNYRHYLPTIQNGLLLIGDEPMIKLIHDADRVYFEHRQLFVAQLQKADWAPLYKKEIFNEFDNTYYQLHDNTMDLIEKYVRVNPDEFVKLK